MVFLYHSVSTEVGIQIEFIGNGLVVSQQEIQVGFLKVDLVLPVLTIREPLCRIGPFNESIFREEIATPSNHKFEIIIELISGRKVSDDPILGQTIGVLIHGKVRVVMVVIVVVELLEAFQTILPVIPKAVYVDLLTPPNEQVHHGFRTITVHVAVIGI